MVHQINDEIRDKEVRLVDSDGSQLGIVNTKDALRMATERELDLVKIAPTAVPPVCKLMDYGKFRFEQAKKEKEAKKHQRIIEIKEIRLSPGIDIHDFNFKSKNAKKFLLDGDKVKVSIRFRGREMAHTSIGHTQMNKFAEELADVANVERPPKLDGRNMSMFLAPKPPEKIKKGEIPNA